MIMKVRKIRINGIKMLDVWNSQIAVLCFRMIYAPE
jgi:hypothetical protein